MGAAPSTLSPTLVKSISVSLSMVAFLAMLKVLPCRIGYGPSAANSRPACVVRDEAKSFKFFKFAQNCLASGPVA
jgi:hypothetical protein